MMGREHFIAELVKKHGWTRGAELGLWYGRTIGYLLKACPDLHMIGVDLFAPQPDHPERDSQKSFTAEFGHESNEKRVDEAVAPYSDRVCIYKMYTHEAADLLEDESLDFVFIDADHSEKGVERDIECWGPLVRKGGYIIGHDIDWPTVKRVVDRTFAEYETGPDNVWYVVKT